MKWVYGIAVLLAVLQLIVGEVGSVSPNPTAGVALVEAVEILASESGVPNTVTGLILRNRLYDTVFEVVVFSTAILGAQYLLADEQPTANVAQFTDIPSIVLASSRVWARPERGTAKPIRCMACLKRSRSSAFSMASRLAPINSTPY